MLDYRVGQLEGLLEDVNEHGSKPVLMLRADVSRMDNRVRDLEKDVKEIPLLRQDVQRYADSFKALRTALYAVAGTIIAAAVAILLFGGGGI